MHAVAKKLEVFEKGSGSVELYGSTRTVSLLCAVGPDLT
jgi:hypothetical protein